MKHTAPDRLEIRSGGGCVSLFGIPFILAGVFLILVALQIIPMSNAEEVPFWAWPVMLLMGEEHLMQGELTTIKLPLIFRMGSVNCFLAKADTGFVLFDTGGSNSRSELERTLSAAGCNAGDLRLIILTHGDFDHSGNAAYLRQRLGAPIAMHAGDVGMVEQGDMSWNRQSNRLMLKMTSGLFGFGKSERFTPDVLLSDGDDLSAYGLDGTVMRLPGHSGGSIGILLSSGGFICGDLLENSKQPGINGIMDDREAAKATVEALKGYAIRTVYPGHGEPFPMESLKMESAGAPV